MHTPTQFQVSSKLIASMDLRGNKGLLMLATTTGEYEPCVQAMMMLIKTHYPNHDKIITTYEGYTRSDFKAFDPYQRVNIVLSQLRSLPLK